MPLPSPSRQTTLRSGHATAAPVATGSPIPIDPPMLLSQSCGAAALGGAKKPRPAGAARLGQRFERADRLLVDLAQYVAPAILGREQARLVGIGEERDRHLRAD